MKEKYQKKYQPNQPEDLHSNGRVNRVAFATRIVNTENRTLSVKEAWSLVNKRDAKRIGLNQARFGAALSAAVRVGRIDKTRIQETPTRTAVVYHPTNMKPMGLDIPVPSYTRDTTPNDDVSWETIECGNCDATFPIDEGLDIGGIDYCRECYDTISAKENVFTFDEDDDVFTFDDDEEEPIVDFDAEKMTELLEQQLHEDFGKWRHTPMDKELFNRIAELNKREGLTVKHNKDEEEEANECWKCGSIVAMEDTIVEGTKSFCSSCAIPAPVKVATEQRDAVVSTIQHHFTAEQLLDTLNNLNPDLHDDVIVAIFDALGKNNYSPFHHDFTKPQPRKTALLSWAFVSGNLVVKE